jgi:hypothetical protein
VARFDYRDRRNETIAAAGQSFDEAGILGRIAERFAELIDRGSKAVVEVDDGVAAPEALLNFFAGHQLARAIEKANQDAKGLRLQPDADAGPAQFTGFGISLEKAEGEPGRRFFLMFDWGRHGVGGLRDTTLYLC